MPEYREWRVAHEARQRVEAEQHTRIAAARAAYAERRRAAGQPDPPHPSSNAAPRNDGSHPEL